MYFFIPLGTPTLSKLLEAPANPYIPSPALSIQKIKPSKCFNVLTYTYVYLKCILQ